MAQYISKSALVAEMEKRIKGLKDCHADAVAGYAGEIFGLERLLSFIDTLETKEVDLNRESAWKPSDEQMEAFADALSLAKSCGEERAFDLRTLYEQLEKLKGE